MNGRRWTDVERIGVLGAFALVFAVAAALLIARKARPSVVLTARSHAVVFVPSRVIDLVGTAAPRHGLEPGGTPFTGIRFTPPLLNDASLRAFTGMPVAATPGDVRSLQRLEVTPACAVRLEDYVDSLIRLDVEQPVASDSTCHLSANLMVADTSGLVPVEFQRAIKLGAPATLIFQPSHPLHLRNVPVSAVRFETSDTGLVRSAILHARLEIPTVGNVGADAPTAYPGDAVTLGDIEGGSIVELVVGDTIETLFKGDVSRPAIARRDLRPPMLEHLAHTHWRLGLAFVTAGLTLVVMFLPKVK